MRGLSRRVRPQLWWLFFLLISAPVGAHPSLLGATGLVVLPTAETVPAGQFETALAYAPVDAGANDAKLTQYSARGVMGLSDRCEIYGLWTRLSDAQRTDGGAVGVKYVLVRRPGTQVAVGVEEFHLLVHLPGTLFVPDVDYTGAYLVLTKALQQEQPGAWYEEAPPPRLIGHLGVRWARYDFDFRSPSMLAPFFGLEARVNERISLVAEARRRDSSVERRDLTSYAVRYRLNERFEAEAGETNGALGGLARPKHDLFIDLSYRW